jgi:hypothetical protein
MQRTLIYAGASVFVASLGSTILWRSRDLRRDSGNETAKRALTEYTPAYSDSGGEQIVMLYFGSAHCAWADSKELPSAVEAAKLSLRSQAQSKGWGFEAIGVALDWSWVEGASHLAKMGSFDEISSGLNWSNSMALKYLGGEDPGPESTPEIVVLRRTVVKPDFVHTFAYRESSENLLVRKIGLYDIQRWVRIGAPIPGFGSSPRG